MTTEFEHMSNQDVTYTLAKLLLDASGAPYTIKREVTRTKLELLREQSFTDAVEVTSGCLVYRLDFCNVANDIWPLIDKNKIDLIALEDGYAAEGNFSYLDFDRYERTLSEYNPGYLGVKHSNGLRAAACCLILKIRKEQKSKCSAQQP